MTSISDIRKNYPQYDDLSDEKLLRGLHKKFYSDMDFSNFAGRIEGANLGADPGAVSQRNPDGTYGQPPEGAVFNPYTGQITERSLMYGADRQAGVSPAESVALGFGEGATFGASDEMMGGLRAAMPGPGMPGERYAFGRERARALSEASRAENPWTHGLSEAVGGAATSLSFGIPAIANRGLTGATISGAGVGAGEGIGYGFLSGEGGFGDRLESAAKYGLLGAGIGGAVPSVTSLATKGGQTAKDLVLGVPDYVRNSPRQTRANRALAKTFTASGRSLDESDAALRQAALEGQPEYRAMDALGISGQRRASSVARSGGDGSTEIREFLDARQAGQPERVSSALEDAFDLRGSTARAARETLEEGRKRSGDINFGGIRTQGNPVDVRPVLSVLDQKITPYERAGISSPIAKRLKKIRSQLAGRGDDGSYELSDFNKVFTIRKDLKDAISKAYSQGKSEMGRGLKDIRVALDDALSASSDEYAGAMRRYADQSRTIDAIEKGQEMARPGSRSADNARVFSGMTGDQQAAARTGYGDTALARLEASPGDGNRARPLTSPKVRGDAAAIAIDNDALQRRVGREMDMFETRNVAVGGSRTADNLADIQDLAGYDLTPLANIASGNYGVAVGQVARQMQNALTGMNDSTRKLITDALMAGDMSAFRKAMAQVETVNARNQIINTIARAGLLRASEPESVVSGGLLAPR